jgi:hypothetical protein
MNIIQEDDFTESLAPIRGMYKRAFKNLVLQALLVTREKQNQASARIKENRLLEYRPASSPAASLDPSLDQLNSLATREDPSARSNLTSTSSSASKLSSTSLLDYLDIYMTRYRTDYFEIKRLGRGGFGSVWHVRHKLDGIEYAIKRIPIDHSKNFHRVPPCFFLFDHHFLASPS